MTLLLTAGCKDFVVQVSDRRFSLVKTHGGKVEFVEPKTDQGNKELVIDSFAGRLAIAFTGRAEIEGGDVGLWMIEVMSRTKAAAVGIMQCAKELRGAANSIYSSLTRVQATDALEFVLAGFDVSDPRPIVIVVSNSRTNEFKRLAAPQRTFNILRPSNQERPFWAAGYTPAMAPEAKRRIHALLKRDYGHLRVADALVRETRRAADHPEHGNWIGMNCMSICIPRSGSARSYYHSGNAEPVSYGPAVLQVRKNAQGKPWHLSSVGTATNAVGGEIGIGDNSLTVVDRRSFPM